MDETCRHFYGRIPFEDYLELKDGDNDFCICDLCPDVVRRADPRQLRGREVVNANQRTPNLQEANQTTQGLRNEN